MKKYLMFCLTILLSATALQAARENALEKEMEDYARDFYREHPDAAGDKKSREAREDLVKKMKGAQVLDLTKDQEKKLRKREDLVTDGTFKTALDQLKALNSKEPDVTFLIAYAEKEKIKPAEKLLAHRLIQHTYQSAMQKATEARGQRMYQVMAKYTEYKSANGKAPASLAELNLPDDCKQFVDPTTGAKKDWIYIGHLGARLKANESHIVLAEPEPLGEARVCGLDDGKIVNFKESSIKEHLDKLANATPSGDGDSSGANVPTGSNSNHPGFATFKSLMKKYKIHKQLNGGRAPESLSDLDLTDEEKQYTDPDGGGKSDWIFLGDKSKIKNGDGTACVLVSPKAYKGVRLIGLADGRTATIADKDITPHLSK
ncbi:hypothetical protein NT6N_03770 [Oceaniferula spumae]|uniref:Uncharacterized protein n=1 Tax=Oceaniferula spumae TaxID=2979115 RepID=A0AAT9FH90_9BACT